MPFSTIFMLYNIVFIVFNATFNNIYAIGFIDEVNRSTKKKIH